MCERHRGTETERWRVAIGDPERQSERKGEKADSAIKEARERSAPKNNGKTKREQKETRRRPAGLSPK